LSRVFLGLGSNVGDRETYLKKAVEAISRFKSTRVCKLSSIYETEPWGRKNQGDFLNMVILIETTLSPETLLFKCLEIEKSLGRTIRSKWGEREIDIDLLLFAKIQVHSNKLKIPHPRILERKFVLVPLSELNPNVIIPGSDITVKKALELCEDQGGVVLYKSVQKMLWRRLL
jgi:2-amino-4-hydroxy-6-hydroxymethyldihydropteridine diphosphokinase